MSRKTYAIGDTVMLKADLFRRADGSRDCRIVGILPADHGEAQYRVRLGNETHERRIVASDIETPDASRGMKQDDTPPARRAQGEPWFKPSSIRIRK